MTTGGSTHHLAQLNVARALAPLDSQLLADFMAALDPVNARAELAPGFVWRLQDESGNATDVHPTGDENLIVNLTVWESVEALRAFAYRDREHLAVLRRRREWFERMDTYLVLWWVPAGHEPSIEEAMARLATLAACGPSPEAFTFRASYPPPGTRDAGEAVLDERDLCPA